MNKKTKSFIVYLLLILCFMLAACVSDPASFYFNYDELKENAVSIELINYDNPDVKTVKKKDDILAFDFDKMVIVETLEWERSEDFLHDLSEIHFHVSDDLTKYSNSANGTSIRIVYTNGDFVIICSIKESNFVGTFTADGKVKTFIVYENVEEIQAMFTGHQDYVNLVNNYFNTQID